MEGVDSECPPPTDNTSHQPAFWMRCAIAEKIQPAGREPPARWVARGLIPRGPDRALLGGVARGVGVLGFRVLFFFRVVSSTRCFCFWFGGGVGGGGTVVWRDSGGASGAWGVWGVPGSGGGGGQPECFQGRSEECFSPLEVVYGPRPV